MAAPVQSNITTGSDGTSATTSHPITSTSGTTHRVLSVAFGADPGTVTPPSGWSQKGSTAGGPLYLVVLATDASSNTSTSFNVTTANSVKAAWVCEHTTGNAATLTLTTTTGAGSTPDPPNHTFTSGDYALLALVSQQGNRSVTGYPTGFTEGTTDSANGSAAPTVGRAEKAVTSVASDNPDTFSASGGTQWTTATVSIPEVVTAPLIRPATLRVARQSHWNYQ